MVTVKLKKTITAENIAKILAKYGVKSNQITVEDDDETLTITLPKIELTDVDIAKLRLLWLRVVR